MKKSLLVGLFLFTVCQVLSYFELGSLSPSAMRMLGVVVLMAVFWLCESIPLAATSIIPLFAFPLLGIMPSNKVALAYGSNIIWLFMTGFFIAKALEKWGLHRRIAIQILKLIGLSPSRLIGGFLLATALISCWISNTATTLLMLPIAISTIGEVAKLLEKQQIKMFATALMLAICFGANIGGMGTPLGSPPNLIFLGVLQESFPNLPEIGFLHWMEIAFPIIGIFLILTWIYLLKSNRIDRLRLSGQINLSKLEQSLGPISKGELLVGILFAMTIVLWITRSDINIGTITISGWASALGLSKYIKDTAVGALVCVILFAVKAPSDIGESTPLLDWKTAKDIHWEILLLFGGGIALSKGIISSGLSDVLANNLGNKLTGMPQLAAFVILCLLMSILTEFTSNTAMTSLMMPIIASIAPFIGINPALLMMPVALSASCAFMLPIATPPNAIVYSQNYFSIATMAKTGLVLNLIGVILISSIVHFIGTALLVV